MSANPGSENLFAEGKAASPRELQARLSRERAEFLQGAVQNPNFSEDHVASILSNPDLPGAAIQQIAARPKWLARYEIKRAIVLHRNAPRPLRMNLIHFLRWRDLVRVVDSPGGLPSLKRAGETLLKARVEAMSIGERMALCRVASPGVIPSLLFDPHPEVMGALLNNGRLTEEDVVRVCAGEQVPPTVAALVARHPIWGVRYAVKISILRNVRTPAAVSLGILESLRSEDLQEVIASSKHSRLLRATARKLLACRTDFVDTDKTVT